MAEPPANGTKPAPKTTLQYLILYPTLLLSLGGSIPTVLQTLKAWRLDTSYQKVQLAEEQDQLWKRNLACVATSSSWEVDSGQDHVTVKITVCKVTGDILVRYFSEDTAPQYRWVRAPERARKD